MENNDLRAIIMAGGMGTRLRPITDDIPKPLAPIGDECAASVVLRMLSNIGVKEALLTLMYKGEQIKEELGESKHGISLSYITESEPLGTAGSVKNAKDFILGSKTFIVASADAVCDFDLSEAIEYHHSRKALATIVLTRVKDPGEYGIVLGDFGGGAHGKITNFIEKPSASQAYSDLVNTGIYILSEKILEKIPKGQKFDFARDLFPSLIGEGLFGYKAEGYWCDIGSITAYKECLFDAANNKIATATLCRTGDNGSIIGTDCNLAPSANISNSVLHSFVTVCDGSSISDSVVCKNTLIEENVLISHGAVIGAGSIICSGAKISGAKLSAGTIVPSDSVILEEKERPLPFWRGKVSGIDKNDIPFLAGAILPLLKEKRVGLMYKKEDTPEVNAIMNVLGERCALLGKGHPELAVFAATNLDLAFVMFADENGGITFFSSDGMLVSREFERKIIGNFKRIEPEKSVFKPFDMRETLISQYLCALKKCAPDRVFLDGIAVSISEYDAVAPLAHTIRSLGAKPRSENEDGYHFDFSEDGYLISMSEYTNKKVYTIGASHIASLLLLEHAEHGETLVLPARAPKVLDFILNTIGATPKRLSENDSSENTARPKMKFWLCDSGAAVISVLCMIKKHNCSLSEEMKKLPEFVFIKKEVRTKRSSSEVMRTILADSYATGDGVRLDFAHGSLSFIPCKKNEAFVFCDAESAEHANEIIYEVQKKYDLHEI